MSKRATTTTLRSMTSVDLPAEILSLLGATPVTAPQCLLELALVELVRRGEVSTGWAAARLGVTRVAFLQLLDERKVGYLRFDEDEALQPATRAAVTRPTR